MRDQTGVKPLLAGTASTLIKYRLCTFHIVFSVNGEASQKEKYDNSYFGENKKLTHKAEEEASTKINYSD